MNPEESSTITSIIHQNSENLKAEQFFCQKLKGEFQNVASNSSNGEVIFLFFNDFMGRNVDISNF